MKNRPLQPKFGGRVNIKVIGLGGVGSIVAEYLTLWTGAQSAAHPESQFRIVLIDGDHFESDNARMFFGALGPKALVKRDDLLDRIGDRFPELSISAVEEYVDESNVERLIHEDDIVLLCVDRHASRKLVSEYFEKHIDNGVLISAGNDGVGEDSDGIVQRGTYGNCQVYVRRDGTDVTPSLTAFHPEIRNPADTLPTDESCTEQVASVPQLLFANYWAAGTILSSMFLSLCDGLGYSELAFDFAEGKMMPIDLPAPVVASLR